MTSLHRIGSLTVAVGEGEISLSVDGGGVADLDETGIDLLATCIRHARRGTGNAARCRRYRDRRKAATHVGDMVEATVEETRAGAPASAGKISDPQTSTPEQTIPPTSDHVATRVAASRKARSPRPLAAEIVAVAKRLWDYHEGLRVKHGLATRPRGFNAQGREVATIARLLEHVGKREGCSREEAVEHVRRWRFQCVIQARDATKAGDARAGKLREWCAGESAWRPTSYDATDGGGTFDRDPTTPESTHYPER